MGYLAEFRKRKRQAIDTGAHSTAVAMFAIGKGESDPSCWEENGELKMLPCLPMMEQRISTVDDNYTARLKKGVQVYGTPKTVITNEKGERFVLDAAECKQFGRLWREKLAVMQAQALAG